MNAHFEHSKPARIVTLEGIHVLDRYGQYVPEEIDPPSRYAGPILIAACVVGWAAFIGAAYAIYRALAALGIA
jgi:hypothetical protein